MEKCEMKKFWNIFGKHSKWAKDFFFLSKSREKTMELLNTKSENRNLS